MQFVKRNIQVIDHANGRTLDFPTFGKPAGEDAINQLEQDVTNKINHLESLVGAPLKASAVAQMTNVDKIYVYTGSETGYTSGHWYYHNGTAWTDGGVYNSTAFETDKTLAVQNMAADAKKTGDEIDSLKEDLTQDNVPAIKRDMLYHAITNYLNPNDITNGYLGVDGVHHNNAIRFYTGFIPVSEGDVIRTYRRIDANTLRFTVDTYAKFYTLTAYNASKQAVSASGTSTASNTYTVPSGISYVRISFYNELKNNLGMITINYEPNYYEMYGDRYTGEPAFLDGAFSDKTDQPIISKGYKTVTGALSSGDKLEIPPTAVKLNQRYAFSAKITTFSKILVGRSKNSAGGSWAVIDSTNVTVYTQYSNSDTPVAHTEAHGLTISDFIYAEIISDENTSCKVTVQTASGSFTTENTTWYGYSSDGANAFAESDGSTLTDCVFSFASGEFRKHIWLYGDSYVSMTGNARWAYYLKENGFLPSVMIAGSPGLAPREAYPSFYEAIRNYGRPYMAIWALGMNGDADSNGNMGPLYKLYLDYFLDKCKIYKITPILCTIPTVPTLNHEVRNAWIRSSGYRYIDFADAVGAQADGTWYTGMLDSDGVHPTVQGALALYLRAIRDCPELTYYK